MAKFSATNQPTTRRDKTRLNRLKDALKRKGHTEEDFYDKIVEIAYEREDVNMLREVLIRFYPIPKSVAPDIKFEYPSEGTPIEKVNAVIQGVADGDIPTDLGKLITDMIKTACDVHESTELAERLEKLESMLAEQQAADGA